MCLCVFTLQQGGYEGRGHAAGAEQHGVAHLELPLWDPAEDHGCYGGQETHHCSLNLWEGRNGIYCCAPSLRRENKHYYVCEGKRDCEIM